VITIDVAGIPAPQGSKRGIVVGGRAVLVESSAKVKPWRSDVRDAAAAAYDGPPLAGPLFVEIAFRLPRPKAFKRTASLDHAKRPDIDKLVRSTLDALRSAGVYGDDSQVCRLFVAKYYAARSEVPGARIRVGETS
jgi:Holliday junction resolvase RusA-like endonuclease